MGSDRGLLLVIGSNPPATTSGARTLNRVELARRLLGYQEVRLRNPFALASYRSEGLSDLGAAPEGWLTARQELAEALGCAAGVLFAYGTQPPTGPARAHFREQVRWLHDTVESGGLPCWWVGNAPRHPSRWQRFTCRQFPDLAFAEALSLALTLCSNASTTVGLSRGSVGGGVVPAG